MVEQQHLIQGSSKGLANPTVIIHATECERSLGFRDGVRKFDLPCNFSIQPEFSMSLPNHYANLMPMANFK